MRRKSLILNTDSYKCSHFKQYPPGTEFVSSYIESRGGRWDKTLFFGLQAFLREYLTTPITQKDIDDADVFFTKHCGSFNKAGWQYILRVYNGKLPIRISAVAEGTVVEGKNVLLQIVNTDPQCFWLTSYVETMLLRAVWYPTTVATNSFHIKQVILNALNISCEKPNEVLSFMLNDFGSRGVSSLESSELGGMGHLVNFMGTDNVPAVDAARVYYNCDMAGFSIAAAEHSTITSWGGPEHEVEAFSNMIDQFSKNGILAVVSDSYDIYNAVSHIWGEQLKEKVKTCGARVVIRPDSGDPVTTPVKIIEILLEKFGYDFNTKGYKVLPTYVRVIQGDGINIDSITRICQALISKGISVENICFGMGGALLQQIDRDTLKFAMKCSAVYVNGEWRDVYKDPIDDKGKASKKGILGLYQIEDNRFVTDRIENGYKYKTLNLLKSYYENGNILALDTLQNIRDRSSLYL